MSQPWVVLSGADIAVRVIALFGAIGTAMWGYFPLHDDLRTRDGLRLTPREKWEHIFGILAYFVLGAVVFGGVCEVVVQIIQALVER